MVLLTLLSLVLVGLLAAAYVTRNTWFSQDVWLLLGMALLGLIGVLGMLGLLG